MGRRPEPTRFLVGEKRITASSACQTRRSFVSSIKLFVNPEITAILPISLCADYGLPCSPELGNFLLGRLIIGGRAMLNFVFVFEIFNKFVVILRPGYVCNTNFFFG